MDQPTILWIDFRLRKSPSYFYNNLTDRYQVHCVTEFTAISRVIQKVAPLLLCFDYDYPDLPRLKVMRQTKLRYSSIPILMLTEYHSEALAVWAFRTGVRDYIVKPVMVEDLLSRIGILSRLIEAQSKDGVRANHIPVCPIPVEVRFYRTSVKKSVTLYGVNYIHTNYSEKISLNDIARVCSLSPFQFSRAFKREQGMTPWQFIVQYRISKAMELLRTPGISVTEVAFAVGFNDLSYFARRFRQYAGVSPSKYCLDNSPH